MPTNPPRPAAARSPIWLGMLVLYVVWGSTYLGIAVAVDTIPPFIMAATRFLIAGIVLLAWSVAREGRSFRPPRRRARGRNSGPPAPRSREIPWRPIRWRSWPGRWRPQHCRLR